MFVEPVGMQVDIGDVGERLQCNQACIEAITKIAKSLCRAPM